MRLQKYMVLVQCWPPSWPLEGDTTCDGLGFTRGACSVVMKVTKNEHDGDRSRERVRILSGMEMGLADGPCRLCEAAAGYHIPRRQ